MKRSILIGVLCFALGAVAFTQGTNSILGPRVGSTITGANNVVVGNNAGPTLTTGVGNTIVGAISGDGLTTGSYNTIIGRVNGLSPTLANNVIIADGQGNVKAQYNAGGQFLAAYGGIEATPSYSFVGDTDTGIYHSSANTIAIGTGSSVAISIDSTNLAVYRTVYINGGGGGVYLTSGASEGAGVIAIKNGANAQELRVYGTTTGNKYFSLKDDGTNSILDSTSGALKLGATLVTPASSGTRFLCISTTGVVTSSAAACSGT